MLEMLNTIPASFFSRDGKRLSFVAYAFLALLCVGFFTPGIVTMPPTDRDESSFAQASKQMIESGNLTDIRLQTKPRYKKPIGIYWLQSTAARVLNPQHLNEIWAYRAPSFIGATVAVLMTAALGALLFSPATGLLAAIMLAGCVLLNVEARLAKTDAALLGCVVVAMYGLAKAFVFARPFAMTEVISQSPPPLPNPPREGEGVLPFSVAFLFWTAFAVGVLIKGPIILLPVLGVLVWTKISNKNIAWFRALRPVLGLVYALALIAPWFVVISMQSHGAFMEQSAGHDMLAKLWQGQDRGMMPPGLHLMALPLVFFPYALFVVFAAPDIWKNKRDAAVKFCLGWIVPTWFVFEVSLTKLPHYVLPAYPAIALLTAKYLLDGFPTLAATTRRLPIALIVGMWLMIGAGFAFVFSALPAVVDKAWDIPQIAAGGVLFLAQGAALLLLPRQKTASLVALTLGGLVFMAVTFGYTLPRLQHIWMSRKIVEAVERLKPCEQSQIVSVGYNEPSLAFMAGTDTMMLTNAVEAAEAMQQNACRVAVINATNKQGFLNAFAQSKQRPQEAGTIDGLNAGHGAQAALTIFTVPQGTP